VSQIGAMTIAGSFGIVPYINNVRTQASTWGLEAAFTNLFRKLNPVDATPREIRATRNDGVAVKLTGILAIPNQNSTESPDTKDASFVCTLPYWEAQGFQSGGGFQ
jgi:hypothetical protein